MLAASLGNLGWCDFMLGDIDRAQDFFRRAETPSAQISAIQRLSAALLYDPGRLRPAASYQQRAAALARDVGNDAWPAIKRRLGNRWSLLYSELIAAAIDMTARRYEQAISAYRTAIEGAPRAHASDVLWQAYGQLAFLYRQIRRPTLAEAQYRNAIGTIDREWDKLKSDDWKTTFLAPGHLIGFFEDYVDFLIDQGTDGESSRGG
jgi:tetratricopeptide (TPR) repeat protein